MRFTRYFSAVLFTALFLFVFAGCSGSLGYSVLLWSNENEYVKDGTIVKVYVKSNISKSYVVSELGKKRKFEVPLWQITEPSSKANALRKNELYSDFVNTYASVKLDGLPIREEALNTSKQVYRLREGEIVRCLYRGEGAAVTNGKGDIAGEWLRVLTGTGTEGWCFSHNLELFKITSYEVAFEKKQKEESDAGSADDKVKEEIVNLSMKNWYPDTFREMVKNNRINPDKVNKDYGFNFGIVTSLGDHQPPLGSILFNSCKAVYQDSSIYREWRFTDIKKISSSEYEFVPAGLTFKLVGKDSALLQYMESGKVKNINLVSMTDDIMALAEKETDRREKMLEEIYSSGPEYRSSNYGTLKFVNRSFLSWKGFNLLVPSVISASAGNNIYVSIEYFISNSLKSSYDGALTMTFENTEEQVNFLYKLTDTGLRLEVAADASYRDDLIISRSSSPLVLFFEKK